MLQLGRALGQCSYFAARGVQLGGQSCGAVVGVGLRGRRLVNEALKDRSVRPGAVQRVRCLTQTCFEGLRLRLPGRDRAPGLTKLAGVAYPALFAGR